MKILTVRPSLSSWKTTVPKFGRSNLKILWNNKVSGQIYPAWVAHVPFFHQRNISSVQSVTVFFFCRTNGVRSAGDIAYRKVAYIKMQVLYISEKKKKDTSSHSFVFLPLNSHLTTWSFLIFFLLDLPVLTRVSGEIAILSEGFKRFLIFAPMK